MSDVEEMVSDVEKMVTVVEEVIDGEEMVSGDVVKEKMVFFDLSQYITLSLMYTSKEK